MRTKRRLSEILELAMPYYKVAGETVNNLDTWRPYMCSAVSKAERAGEITAHDKRRARAWIRGRIKGCVTLYSYCEERDMRVKWWEGRIKELRAKGD